MEKKISKIRKSWAEARSVWDESALRSQTELPKIDKFAHFCVMVLRSFTRNRCPVRASALAYASLLALIPMLAVVMSITSTFLKKEGEERIDEFIVKLVATLTPPAMLSTNVVAVPTDVSVEAGNQRQQEGEPRPETSNSAAGESAPPDRAQGSGLTAGKAGASAVPATNQEEQMVKARKEIARSINKFIQNTRSGALGVTGSILLIFVAISMLSRIEDTFNDIWGVSRGRSWFMRIVLYSGVISLMPLLLIVALGLATGSHLESTGQFILTNPFISRLPFHLLPAVVLCFSFGLLSMTMPTTNVPSRAVVVGDLVGG